MPDIFSIAVIFIVAVILIVIIVLVINGQKNPQQHQVPSREKAKRVNPGERWMAAYLRGLPEDKYKVVNDLMVLYNGHTVQIDHVVVSQYGVFVIETKDYRGWIHGGANSDYWTQSFRSQSFKFYNPVLQNSGHVKALSNMLSLDPSLFVSIVAFTENADLRIGAMPGVMYMRPVSAFIQSYTQPLLSEERVQRICQWLSSLNIDSESVRNQHVNNVKEAVNWKQSTVAKGICPRCGGKLVLRNGQYGQFYGCQNYPGCRFLQKL